MLIVITETQAKQFKEAGIAVSMRPVVDTEQFTHVKPVLFPTNKPEDRTGVKGLAPHLFNRLPFGGEGIGRSSTLADWADWAEGKSKGEIAEEAMAELNGAAKQASHVVLTRHVRNKDTLITVTRQGTRFTRMTAETKLAWGGCEYKGKGATAVHTAYLVLAELFEEAEGALPRHLVVKALRKGMRAHKQTYHSYQLSMLAREGYVRLAH